MGYNEPPTKGFSMSNTNNTQEVFAAHNENVEKNEQFLQLCGLAGTIVGTTISTYVAYQLAKRKYNQ